jgi:hypothetical protein
MDPRSEAEDLRKNQLPAMIPEEGKPLMQNEALLPTQIHYLDELIAQKEIERQRWNTDCDTEIQLIRDLREAKMAEAIQKKIIVDDEYRIKSIITTRVAKTIVDVAKFRTTNAVEYLNLIRGRIAAKLAEAEAIRVAETDPVPGKTGEMQLRSLKPGEQPPSAVTKKDLETVITGKGAPAKRDALMVKSGDDVVAIEYRVVPKGEEEPECPA